MKKLVVIIALMMAVPLAGFAQIGFDSYEDEDGVTSIVVTKNMFKLLAEIDLESDDPEVKEYLELVNNLNNMKVFITENAEVAARMAADVKKYIASSSNLNELMRVKDDGKNIKFYSKEGKTESIVSELLMFMTGDIDGKEGTMVMSITGDIDLKKISKLTKDMNIPGSEQLEKIEQKQ